MFDPSHLIRYSKLFRDNGVRGVDILALTDEQLTSLGITSSLHVGRIKISKAQLIKHQERLDNEVLNVTPQHKQNYQQIEQRYLELLRATPDYALPQKMSKWTPLDVYLFAKLPENRDKLAVFKKPLAMCRVDGAALIEMTRDMTKKVCDTVGSKLIVFVCIVLPFSAVLYHFVTFCCCCQRLLQQLLPPLHPLQTNLLRM